MGFIAILPIIILIFLSKLFWDYYDKTNRIVNKKNKREPFTSLKKIYMNIFQKKTAKKNYKRLVNICEELVQKYESESPLTYASCWPDLKTHLEAILNSHLHEIATWKDSEVNYIQVANTQLFHITYDLLISGYYHLRPGLLNPMSCANNLILVNKKSLEWAVENHIISESEKETEINNLYRQI